MSWSDYGFPDPTFQPPLLPMRGLAEALKERCTAARIHARSVGTYGWAGTFPYSDSDITEFLDTLQTMSAFDVHTFKYFDTILEDICRFFINTKKTEYMFDLSPPYYTWQELLSVIEEEDTTGVGALESNYSFLPWLSVIWAKQRKRMLELLIYLPVDFRADRYSAYSNQYATWEDLIAHAKSIGTITYGVKIIDSSSFDATPNYYLLTYPYVGNRSVRIEQTANIRPDIETYPELTGAPSIIFYACFGGYIDVFDDLGTGVILGRNWIASPAFDLMLPLSQKTITAPTWPIDPGTNDIFTGFHATMLCVVNFSPLFEFYDNVDEIPTP